MQKKGVIEKALKKKISRRDFIKKGLVAVAGVSLGAYGLSRFLTKGADITSFGNDDKWSNSVNPSLAHVFKGDAPEQLWKWSRETPFQLKLGDNVQCKLCPNECLLEPGDRSICRTRVNINGTLHSLSYGNPCSEHVDPIEKKPLFHFLPQTTVFSIATAGCNFRCLQCQNWTISQFKPEDTQNYDLMPEKVVEAAIKAKTPSIAYTYSGPIAFYEYMLDTAKLASEKGLKNVWVTQGYMNEKPLRELCKYLDAANVDIKYFSEKLYNEYSAAKLQPVLDCLKILKQEKVWFEITNLVIPTVNDDMGMIKQMSKWIVNELGPDYPLHFSRFHPMYKLTHLPATPIETLEKAREVAMDAGVKYVYIGNVPDSKAESTYCPNDNRVCIERKGYAITENNVDKNGFCLECGEKIEGVWSL